ncbi:MAG: hypothetical protein AAF192_02340 [Pseudomonadota bacterium]
MAAPAAAIAERPLMATRPSARRAPIPPRAGEAATPGGLNAPISAPTSAQPMPVRAIIAGASAATD